MHDVTKQKAALRSKMRQARREHAAALPPEVAALVFNRPPVPVVDLVPEGATIGLYRADPGEAPASGYARFFFERGHSIALPWLTDLKSPMIFREHTDPFTESDLEKGYYGLMQPSESAAIVQPDVLFMPLVAFTEDGARLGQGGGFYDRYLAPRPDIISVGMAWDIQRVDELPIEPHDMPLTAIVTPTRIYGPF